MSNSKSATTFDDLPLILNVNDVASILAISKVSAYELVKSKGFPVAAGSKFRKLPLLSGWTINQKEGDFYGDRWKFPKASKSLCSSF